MWRDIGFTRIIQVQTRKMTCFSKIIWNFKIGSNTLRDIDKWKLCTKFNRAMNDHYKILLTVYDETEALAKVFIRSVTFEIYLKKYFEF